MKCLFCCFLAVFLLVEASGFLFGGGDDNNGRLAYFRLHTRAFGKDSVIWNDWDGKEIKYGDYNRLRELKFDNKLKVVFFVHGWLGSEGNWYIIDMYNAMLDTEDVNFFAVDWSYGSNTLDYAHARQKTKDVGREIADFVKFLEKDGGITRDQVHLIGHSLGGQTVGYAGMNLQNPKVARVTSLDPAEFMYDLSDLDDTIDPSDAEFVDVLHTSWVSRVPKGHVDFYPNNGDTGHMMAVYYYTDSIKAKCRYTSYKCANWKEFEAGKCATDCSNNSCNEMGHYASPDKARGRVYINVKDDAPYCR